MKNEGGKDAMAVYDELTAELSRGAKFRSEKEVRKLRTKALESGWIQSVNPDIVYTRKMKENLFVNLRTGQSWSSAPSSGNIYKTFGISVNKGSSQEKLLTKIIDDVEK